MPKRVKTISVDAMHFVVFEISFFIIIIINFSTMLLCRPV